MKTSPEDNDSNTSNDALHGIDDEAPRDEFNNDHANDDIGDDDDVWASQGYTPLQDMHLITGTGMSNDEDHPSWSGAVLFSEGTSGNTVFASHPGAFFADMNAFGAPPMSDDDDQASDDQDCTDKAQFGDSLILEDFRDVADQALRSLEEDYFATMQGQVRTSTLEETILRPPTATASVAKFKVSNSSKSNEIVNHWPDIETQNEEAESTVDTKPSTTPASTLQIDTQAVRQAVQAIRLRDPKLTNAMHDWERALKESLARVPSFHSLIPPAPLKAFRHKTPKAAAATANLSRSATIAEALARLNVLKQQEVLVIDVLGCDQMECDTVCKIRTLFAPVARWIGANTHGPNALEIRLIGPNMPAHALHFSPVDLIGRNCEEETPITTRNRLKRAQVSCHLGVYDEWLSMNNSQGDLAIAFNAGVWGYKEWRTTIQYLLQRNQKLTLERNDDCRLLFAVTAYTIYEAEDDFEVIREEISKAATRGDELEWKDACLFEPEYNPYGSKVDRPTESAVPGRHYRENNAWQAWRL